MGPSPAPNAKNNEALKAKRYSNDEARLASELANGEQAPGCRILPNYSDDEERSSLDSLSDRLCTPRTTMR